MNEKQQIEFGIQECSKCRYMLRCEECVYNEKDIAELIRFEKQLASKETAREILDKLNKESNGQTQAITNLLRKRYGVEE